MARMKISKKKLQEPDEFLSLSQRAWLWLHENRDRAALIGGGIAAVVLIALGAKAYVDRSRQQRASAVSGAVARYVQASGATAPAELRKEFGTLGDRYAGSPEGAVARFFQAGSLASAGEADQARRLFTELAAGGSGDIAVLSRVALAYLELARGGGDAALTAFQDLLKIQGTAVPRAQIMAEIAAIHEKQGRPAEARRVYEELIESYPEGTWAANAKERVRQLAERGASAS